MQVFNWLKRSGTTTFAVCLLPMSSCAASKCGDYKHFDFSETPNIAISDVRVPALNGLSGVKPFPVSYTITRSQYQITLFADEKSYGPTATLSIASSAVPLTLQIIDSPLAIDGSSCISRSSQNGDVKFFWLDWKGCYASQNVSVAVIDAGGVQIAIENLSFSVVTNGRYCVTDAP